MNSVKGEENRFLFPRGTHRSEMYYFTCHHGACQLSLGWVTTEVTSWKAGCGFMEETRELTGDRAKWRNSE